MSYIIYVSFVRINSHETSRERNWDNHIRLK